MLIFEIRDEINACAPRARKAYINERKGANARRGEREKEKERKKIGEMKSLVVLTRADRVN